MLMPLHFVKGELKKSLFMDMKNTDTYYVIYIYIHIHTYIYFFLMGVI